MAVNALPPFTGNFFRLWCPQWASGVGDVFTQAQAQGAASDYEINVFQYQQLGGSPASNRGATVAAMKTTAPTGVVGVYVNGTYGPAGQKPGDGHFLLPAYHPTGDFTYPYLVDNGSTWLMDPKSQEWAVKSHGTANSMPDEANNRRATQVTGPTADGFLIDNLGTGIIASGYTSKSDNTGSGSGGAYSARNMDTNIAWNASTQSDRWLGLTTYMAAIANGTYGRDTGSLTAFYVNGGDKGSSWWATNGGTRLLAKYAMLVMFENWVRIATSALGVYKNESDWILDCNAMLDLQNKGKGALIWNKVWAGSPHAGHIDGGSPLTSSADDDSDLSTIVIPHRVAAGSFMLCTNGSSFFHFVHDASGGNERIPKDRWYTQINNLGNPTESWGTKGLSNIRDGSQGITGGDISADGTTGGITNAKQAGAAANLYRRTFVNGIVLVNPSGSASNNTYTLPAGTYMDVDGTTYSGTVSVTASQYARLLVKQ